jgi:hypothetical protein
LDRAPALRRKRNSVYAQQVKEDGLRRLAARVHAQAIRRAGELLREIAAARGGDRRSTGGCPPVGRTQAATEAGLSEHQRKTALRVANVPKDEFEEAVERPEPATITELAERGKKAKPRPLTDLGSRTKAEFRAATSLLGAVNSLSLFRPR